MLSLFTFGNKWSFMADKKSLLTAVNSEISYIQEKQAAIEAP